MPYWMRVFCTEGSPASLREILESVERRGITLELDGEMLDADPDSADWEQAAVRYRKGKLPFLAEINRVGDPEFDAAQEIEEFITFVADAPDTVEKERVVDHLRRTSFIVANQIPTTDFDDVGFTAVGEFIRFFVDHNGGLTQADGEGFYEADRLIVPLK
jgi:hypothetical protein